MDLDFKIVTPKELNLLIRISITTYKSAFQKLNNPDDFKTYIDIAFSKKTLQKELLNPNSVFYFVYLDKTLVGYFKLNEKSAQNEQFETLSIELERIYIYKQFQENHIGQHILKKAISISKQKKVTFLWLGVWDQNIRAINFYKRYGFKIFNSHSFFVGNDEQTDLLMQLSLT